ncbi:MAG: hypothetical protein KF908_05155 [Nitrosomonas sp.]|nr:hypothetical protein [Nitrosomonas sp.]
MNRFLELFTDPGTGLLSHTKIWTHIAYLTVTITFLCMTFSGNIPGIDLWLAYLGIVGGHSMISKWISMKYK